jgi:hypothetical protein
VMEICGLILFVAVNLCRYECVMQIYELVLRRCDFVL